jgi:hypothetical protein
LPTFDHRFNDSRDRNLSWIHRRREPLHCSAPKAAAAGAQTVFGPADFAGDHRKFFESPDGV